MHTTTGHRIPATAAPGPHAEIKEPLCSDSRFPHFCTPGWQEPFWPQRCMQSSFQQIMHHDPQIFTQDALVFPTEFPAHPHFPQLRAVNKQAALSSPSGSSSICQSCAHRVPLVGQSNSAWAKGIRAYILINHGQERTQLRRVLGAGQTSMRCPSQVLWPQELGMEKNTTTRHLHSVFHPHRITKPLASSMQQSASLLATCSHLWGGTWQLFISTPQWANPRGEWNARISYWVQQELQWPLSQSLCVVSHES